MTAKDRWTQELKCPSCGRQGTAKLWEYDGWSYTNGNRNSFVDHVPEGFRVEPRKDGGHDFFCTSCDAKA